MSIDSEPSRQRGKRGVTFLIVVLMNLVASVHLVWFYLSYVPCYLDLYKFEHGLERTPFQYRILMMFPLRWAHGSVCLIGLARSLSNMPAWFPHGVRPEGLLEAPVDLLCVMMTGVVARSMYAKASNTGILTPYIYPLTLVMITSTFSLYTLHRVRFVYDFPSLALFSVGLYLVYFKRSRLLFAVVFLMATVNRETSLFLLLFYVLARVAAGKKAPVKAWWPWCLERMELTLTGPLLTCWIGWHLWISSYFAQNPSASWSRVWLNVGILLWPTSWTQILSAFAFCWPIVLLLRREIEDETLRLWQWALPPWLIFMLRYGIFVEVRIFGELIPYMAVMAALLAEKHIVRSYRANT